MNDVQMATQLLKEISEGKKFSDYNFNYTPVVYGGTRYDKCTVGFYYMPWLHNQEFLNLYGLAEKIETNSYQGMSVAPRAYIILKAAESALSLAGGDFVECGVYKGGTALLASEVIMKDDPSNRPGFHLFDTFEGIPDQGLTSGEVEGGRGKQLSDVSLEITKNNLKEYIDFLTFYPGYIPDTFKDFEKRPVRYLHIDINTAKAHRDCVEFFMPQLVEGAVVIFDDYGWPEYGECKQAVDNYYLAKNLPLPVALMTGQGIYVHRKNVKSLLSF